MITWQTYNGLEIGDGILQDVEFDGKSLANFCLLYENNKKNVIQFTL